MTVREIQGHLRELYAVEVSPDLISRVTDAVLEEVRDWQNRPLETVYPIVFFDALRVKIRDEGMVRNKAVYLALALDCRGPQGGPGPVDRAERGRQVLAAGHERAQEPRRRGHPDRRGRWAQGIPRGHQRRLPADDRADLHRPSDPKLAEFVSWKDRKELVPALKPIYRAETPRPPRRLAEFEAKWGKKYPAIAPAWRRNWDG